MSLGRKNVGNGEKLEEAERGMNLHNLKYIMCMNEILKQLNNTSIFYHINEMKILKIECIKSEY